MYPSESFHLHILKVNITPFSYTENKIRYKEFDLSSRIKRILSDFYLKKLFAENLILILLIYLTNNYIHLIKSFFRNSQKFSSFYPRKQHFSQNF